MVFDTDITLFTFLLYKVHIILLSMQEKLCDIIDILIPDPHEVTKERGQGPLWPPEREVTLEAAVTGALEHAFWQMVSHTRIYFYMHITLIYFLFLLLSLMPEDGIGDNVQFCAYEIKTPCALHLVTLTCIEHHQD